MVLDPGIYLKNFCRAMMQTMQKEAASIHLNLFGFWGFDTPTSRDTSSTSQSRFYLLQRPDRVRLSMPAPRHASSPFRDVKSHAAFPDFYMRLR